MDKQEIILPLKNREASLSKGSLSELRKDGWIPAVLYGGEGENKLFSIAGKEFLKEASSGLKDKVFILDGQKARVKHLSLEPVKDRLIHIDFLRVCSS
jgi:large subunit ribosomal protein L25